MVHVEDGAGTDAEEESGGAGGPREVSFQRGAVIHEYVGSVFVDVEANGNAELIAVCVHDFEKKPRMKSCDAVDPTSFFIFMGFLTLSLL
jgi:hypothetical protein